MTKQVMRSDLLIPKSSSRGWITLAVLLAGGLVAVLSYVAYAGWHDLSGFWWTSQEVKSDEQLVRQFAALKNAGDPRADELLSPAPVVPEQAVAPEEAERLDAELILRRPLQVVEVRRVRPPTMPPRFTLVVKGSVRSERFLVEVEGETRSHQRTLFNPDIIVEERDGKLYGVRAQLHED